jgi:GNAT superfamily N-acetyltransferase
MTCIIRPVVESDLQDLLIMIRGFAREEGLGDQTTVTEADLAASLFDPSPLAEVAVACDRAARTLGYALFYSTFIPYTGRAGVFLRSLYVRPEHRGRGVGRQLLRYLARLTSERGATRLEWNVFRANEAAAGFYQHLGFTPMEDRPLYRAQGECLVKLAG